MSGERVTLSTAVLLVGLSAGFFFTYEASVTLGLAKVDDITYVTMFQAINETVTNPWFGVVFFGPIPALGVALVANWGAGRPRRGLLVVALGLYLAVVVITGTGNLPLNDDLATVIDVTNDTATAARLEFEHDWNRLNLARTLAAVASFAVLAVAASGRAIATTAEPQSDVDGDDH